MRLRRSPPETRRRDVPAGGPPREDGHRDDGELPRSALALPRPSRHGARGVVALKLEDQGDVGEADPQAAGPWMAPRPDHRPAQERVRRPTLTLAPNRPPRHGARHSDGLACSLARVLRA